MTQSPDNIIEHGLARIAYAAYAESTGGKNFLGADMPTFDDLPDKIKTAWGAASGAVYGYLLALLDELTEPQAALNEDEDA